MRLRAYQPANFGVEPTGSRRIRVIKRFAVLFAVLALATASAETFKLTLFEPAVVQGKELKPGSYKLDLKDTKLVIANGKTSVETSVKVETADQKFNATSVRYANTEGKYSIQEIRLGGTRTRLVLNP